MIAAGHLPRVAIVGRPNVGKSSLFNRIVGERMAIIEDEPGTTRDRLEAEVEWRDRPFLLIDTGGYQVEDEGDYTDLIRAQINAAIAEATLVLFCVDARDGLSAGPGLEDGVAGGRLEGEAAVRGFHDRSTFGNVSAGHARVVGHPDPEGRSESIRRVVA